MNEQEIELEKLNQKILQWAGFKSIYGRYYAIKAPDGQEVSVPKFIRSFPDCEKWVFPKLFKDGWDIKLCSDDGYWFCNLTKWNARKTEEWNSIVGTEIPTLAVCRAVEFLIDNGGKK